MSVFWDVRGTMYWDLLPSGATINSHVHRIQLEKHIQVINVKRPGLDEIYFLRGSATQHTPLLTLIKLHLLRWGVIPTHFIDQILP